MTQKEFFVDQLLSRIVVGCSQAELNYLADKIDGQVFESNRVFARCVLPLLGSRPIVLSLPVDALMDFVETARPVIVGSTKLTVRQRAIVALLLLHAYDVAPLYREFESFLVGQLVLDAMELGDEVAFWCCGYLRDLCLTSAEPDSAALASLGAVVCLSTMLQRECTQFVEIQARAVEYLCKDRFDGILRTAARGAPKLQVAWGLDGHRPREIGAALAKIGEIVLPN